MHDEHEFEQEPTEDQIIQRSEWWLTSLGNAMVWARLRVYENGVADVLSSDGGLIRYVDELEARAALMDADYQALDGMDEDDAIPFGKLLEELEPPNADSNSDDDLIPLLIERLDANRAPGTYNV